MNDLITYIVQNLLGHNKFSIEESEEDDAKVYSILLSEEDYPIIIGKRGLTIKAITALCRVRERVNHSLGGERFYIKVESQNL